MVQAKNREPVFTNANEKEHYPKWSGLMTKMSLLNRHSGLLVLIFIGVLSVTVSFGNESVEIGSVVAQQDVEEICTTDTRLGPITAYLIEHVNSDRPVRHTRRFVSLKNEHGRELAEIGLSGSIAFVTLGTSILVIDSIVTIDFANPRVIERLIFEGYSSLSPSHVRIRMAIELADRLMQYLAEDPKVSLADYAASPIGAKAIGTRFQELPDTYEIGTVDFDAVTVWPSDVQTAVPAQQKNMKWEVLVPVVVKWQHSTRINRENTLVFKVVGRSLIEDASEITVWDLK